MNAVVLRGTVIFAVMTWCIMLPATLAEDLFSFARTPGKLPKEVVPRHYELELKPDLDALVFSGRETIELDVLKPASRVVMNAADLRITTARWSDGTAPVITLDETNQLVTFDAGRTLRPGRHRLQIGFTGKINESTYGMFFIAYRAPGGPKKMIATQFEATDARKVFPCFDEPSFRATFTLTAEIPEGLRAVSNMPVAETLASSSSSPGKGWKKVRFKKTPSMATYLLVLVAGELEEIHGRAGRVETRIWFTEGKQEKARYALESSKRLLAYYENYFGVPFPLPKLDHIAMPGGFGGAMEHWGAITYNEGRILYDPKEGSEHTQEQSFDYMAHEMAHQWFGNLVTMAWWDNLWLNEGFASWMGTKATDALNPAWNHWIRTDVQKADVMALDARRSTHPIQRAVASESQIGDAFDTITYQKGMFFIRMLEDYVGPEAFREGLHRYMRHHAYGNTTTADLWQELAAVSRRPVAEFAAGWTEQPGLPVIVATDRCVDGHPQLELRQERFTLLDPTARPLQWKVPVMVQVPGSGDSPALVLVGSAPVQFPVLRAPCEAVVKLNAGSRGYYHVAYDPPMFERLRAGWALMDEADRVGFLGDAWAMVETGRLPAGAFLDLLPNVGRETSLALWEQTLSSLGAIDTLLEGSPARGEFRRKARAWLQPVAAKLGWQPRRDERSGDGQWRAGVLGLLSEMDDEAVVEEARRRFTEFCLNPRRLAGDLRATVLASVGRHATAMEYDKLLQLAKDAPEEEDRDELLTALAQARDPALARRTLNLSLAKIFPPVASAQLLAEVSATGIHAQAAWDFMKEHHRELMALAGGPFENKYAGNTVSGFADDPHADEYVEFIRTHYPPDAIAKAEEAADRIRYKAYLKRQILAGVAQWSKKQ